MPLFDGFLISLYAAVTRRYHFRQIAVKRGHFAEVFALTAATMLAVSTFLFITATQAVLELLDDLYNSSRGWLPGFAQQPDGVSLAVALCLIISGPLLVIATVFAFVMSPYQVVITREGKRSVNANSRIPRIACLTCPGKELRRTCANQESSPCFAASGIADLASSPRSPHRNSRLLLFSPSCRRSRKSVEDRLDADRVRIRQVAEPVLEPIRKLNAYEGDAANQRIKTQTAEVEYENAKLMRKLRRSPSRNTKQGNYVSDLATAKGRVRIAEAEVQPAAESVSNLLPLFMQNKKAATWSVAEKIAVANFEDDFPPGGYFRKRRPNSSSSRRKLNSKCRTSMRKPKRLMELKVQVEKALSGGVCKEADGSVATRQAVDHEEASGRSANPREAQAHHDPAR